MKNRLMTLSAGLLGAFSVAIVASPAAASFKVTYEAPGVQNSTATFSFSGVETFDGKTPNNDQNFTSHYNTGSVITGVYTDVDIRSPDIYGGAGGNTNFASTGNATGYSVDLTTTDPQGINYFGFWLSALDGGNNVTFYKGASQVFSFSASQVQNLLGAGYGGNPNDAFKGANGGQDYAFLNFFDETGTFDKIVFSENPQIGGYESDNHTVGFFTKESGTTVPGVPEPAAWMTMIGGIGFIGGAMRRKHRAGSAFGKVSAL